MKRLIVQVQVFLLVLPVPPVWGSVSTDRRPLRVGVLRYSSGDDTVPSSPILEKRLGRWLENLENVAVEAESLPSSLAALSSTVDSCRPLQAAVEKCQKSFFLKKGSELTSCAPVEPLAHSAAALGLCGEDLQRGWVLAGLAAQANEDWAAQRTLFRRAVRWHPQGLVVSPFGSGEEPEGFRAAQFWGTIRVIKEGLVRDCRVDVKSPELFDTLVVNGFVQEVSPSLQLHRGNRWVVKGEREGKSYRSIVSCPAGNRFRTEVDLVREEKDWELKKHLSQLAEKRSLDSLLVVRPVREQIHLFLYHAKDSGLREVPLDHPLSKKDWESASMALPIRREKLASLLTMESGPILASDSAPVGMLDVGLGREPRWYNSSTFWWVTAGLAVGIASVILVTQQNGQVRPNPAVRIELP